MNANIGCQGQARIRGAMQLRLVNTAMFRTAEQNTKRRGGRVSMPCRKPCRPYLREMKRHGKLFDKITDGENIALAYLQARKGKPRLRGVIKFDQNRERNLELIRQSLLDKTFTTSRYHEKTVFEPKKRTIYILPFSPDRIVQHALMNVVIPIWQPMFKTSRISQEEMKALMQTAVNRLYDVLTHEGDAEFEEQVLRHNLGYAKGWDEPKEG